MQYATTARCHEAIDQDRTSAGHDWRTSRLIRLGLPSALAAVYTDRLDWHQIARLVKRGGNGFLRRFSSSCSFSPYKPNRTAPPPPIALCPWLIICGWPWLRMRPREGPAPP